MLSFVRRSLRLKLVLASFLVQAAILILLILDSQHLMGETLVTETRQRINQTEALLSAALAAPLAQRDYAALNQILKQSHGAQGIDYLVLLDDTGKIVSTWGWDANAPLPVIDIDIAEAEEAGMGRFNTEVTIQSDGRIYGNLRVGYSVKPLIAARHKLAQESLFISILGVLLSALTVAAIAFWLTRHLSAMANAEKAIIRGDFSIKVQVDTEDEVGTLANAFNAMTAAVARNIEELSQANRQQQATLTREKDEHARMVLLLSAMNLGILFVGADNKVLYYNPAFKRIWLIREGEGLTGITIDEVLQRSANQLAQPDHFSKHMLQVHQTHELSDSFEVRMADERVVIQLSYPVRDDNGDFIGRLWIYEDITRERQTAEQLIYLAERDSLTGLYNRHRFKQELKRMLLDADRHQTQLALLFFDLDDFKYVNDTYGHSAGDSILIRVAGEVSAQVRRNEIFGRLGGDEFALLVPDVEDKELSILADRIVRAIGQIPFRFGGKNLRLTSSLGIAVFPKHATDMEDLISHADAAMYQAKESGKNAWRLYRTDLDASQTMVNRLNWNQQIQNALENNLLRLNFHGVYSCSDCELRYMEVLVRMLDDSGRLIMPGHFIPVAEKSGKILDIDRWVIAESIKLLASSDDIPPLSVNISGRSFDDPTLPQYIADRLAQHGVAPHRLHFELTETSAVSDLHDAQRFIEILHQTGCRIVLDDFGSGFSSFAYLKHIQADTLKIDGLFIRNLPKDRDNQVFVKAIVNVARGMQKSTVAEFVEEAETLIMLRSFGVDLVQGYFLDMPQMNEAQVKRLARTF